MQYPFEEEVLQETGNEEETPLDYNVPTTELEEEPQQIQDQEEGQTDHLWNK